MMEGTAEGRRKKRRPGCYRRVWRPPGPDIRDLMDSDKSPDFVEKLAYKYKQKCKIESSTDSESETNTEGTFTRGFSKKASDMKLQFLDPYDGDSEDIPNLSDYSLNNCSLGDMSFSGVSNSLNSHIPEEVAIEDSTFLKSPELAKSTSWTSPALETNDVYMQPMSEVKLPVGIISQSRLSEPSELPVDARIIPEVQGPRLEHSWFMNIDPPKPVRHSENIARVPLQPARLMYDKDIKLYKPPLFKRKLELPHSECGKIKRKKQHTT
ncbi:uncharacterized protein LOC118841955 [Trichosurus vulpecula]|uniref:uncharacterized protein LOC118841955 n=1 Tax=Trichosurus vulpecula TaxID=9337 RepID=UPI00186AE66F|nr:uncharacterized protein LOC118841955 [Trichosurus vulpecula]